METTVGLKKEKRGGGGGGGGKEAVPYKCLLVSNLLLVIFDSLPSIIYACLPL